MYYNRLKAKVEQATIWIKALYKLYVEHSETVVFLSHPQSSEWHFRKFPHHSQVTNKLHFTKYKLIEAHVVKKGPPYGTRKIRYCIHNSPSLKIPSTFLEGAILRFVLILSSNFRHGHQSSSFFSGFLIKTVCYRQCVLYAPPISSPLLVSTW
jgi:hypothetical protein